MEVNRQANKNIFQIWDENGRKLPFAVRRWTWSKYFYAVIKEIKIKKWPYGEARGFLVRDGHLAPFLDKAGRESGLITCAGCYQWELVTNAKTEGIT